ncbi:MAG: 1,4-dihydroxy-2-naphthoate polyprenyltransferase [Ignavibacteria bacterium]|nr:1,4-dihydroxy-2-naphthoate polyprenyltransferase [Ignavibacteria bacterium]
MKNSMFSAWVLAARPKTLLAAFVPVIVGSALAFTENKGKLLPTLVCFFCSAMIQIGTNFTNDLFDTIKGADTDDRLGPVRAVHAGLITRKQMTWAVAVTFGSAFFAGLYLVWLGGWSVFIIGVCSIIAGLIYTAGPYPLAYNGLGDVFSFLFFGIVATMGTFYVNSLEWSYSSFVLSLPVGALITAILVVNNYRDIDQDARAGKNTLVVKFGRAFARAEYIGLIVLAYSIPIYILLVHSGQFNWHVLFPFLSLPFAVKLVQLLYKLEGKDLNKLLELTARLSAVYGLLLAAGILL